MNLCDQQQYELITSIFVGVFILTLCFMGGFFLWKIFTYGDD